MAVAVVRIDTGKTHGWQVRIGPSVGYRSKLFSDSIYKGTRKAKAAAMAWIEEQGLEYRPDRHGPRGITIRSNTSGVTGVYRTVYRRNGREYPCWAAHYSVGPDGKRTHRAKRFYFGRSRSEPEAFELAVSFRRGWEDAYRSGGSQAIRRFFKEWAKTKR